MFSRKNASFGFFFVSVVLIVVVVSGVSVTMGVDETKLDGMDVLNVVRKGGCETFEIKFGSDDDGVVPRAKPSLPNRLLKHKKTKQTSCSASPSVSSSTKPKKAPSVSSTTVKTGGKRNSISFKHQRGAKAKENKRKKSMGEK